MGSNKPMKHTPVPMTIEAEIKSAINIPGLQHIRTGLVTYGDGIAIDNEGTITFYIAGRPCGVDLFIKEDGSYVLTQPDEPKAISWTNETGQPDVVKAAVIDALRARVRAAA